MTTIERFGLSVSVPAGWEAAIYRRPVGDDGAETHPVLHAGSFPLPSVRGDYGSGAVDAMGADDVLITMLEFGGLSNETALFTANAQPRELKPAHFSPSSLQRVIPGHAGSQTFFTASDRAFCLYAVVGSWRRVYSLVRRVNSVLPHITVGAATP